MPIQHAKGITNYVVGGRLQTQLALANLGCIAVHVWGSRRQAPRKPDWVCFDLDPDSGKLADAVGAALKIKAALDALSLVSFPKTSGGKGLHIFVPIRPGPDCDDVLEFAERLGSHLSAAYPRELTMESRIAARKGRVYLDPFRNGFAQTVVSPWSVRRRPGGSLLRSVGLVRGQAVPDGERVRPQQLRKAPARGRPLGRILREAPVAQGTAARRTRSQGRLAIRARRPLVVSRCRFRSRRE